jgi:hypothetical protein
LDAILPIKLEPALCFCLLQARQQLTKVAAWPASTTPILLTTPQESAHGFEFPATDVRRVALSFYEGGGWSLSVDADSLRTLFLFSLATTLAGLQESKKLDRLRQCSECKTLFFAPHRSQIFCTLKCKDKNTARKFKERHKDELAERAHGYYMRRVQKKLGPKQRVARKPKTKQRRED